MNVENYHFIVFEHNPTGHKGEMKVSYKMCEFHFVDAEPIWYIQESTDTISGRFQRGEFKLIEGVLKNN